MGPPQHAPASSSLGGLTANAVSLVRSARESEWLPNYDALKIRSVVKEMGDLFQRLLLAQHLATQLEADDDDEFGGSGKSKRASMSTVIYLDAILRNRQCVLAYLQYRLDVLTCLRWQAGSATVLTDLIGPRPVADGGDEPTSGGRSAGDTIAGRKLSPAERKFVYKYSDILEQYMVALTRETRYSRILDLTSDLQPPPILPEIRIRPNRDIHHRSLQTGEIRSYSKDSLYNLSRSDFYNYVKAGWAEDVTADE
ncbi:DNA replication complex GINS protein PSF1 [Perkinsus olseni]|uniref:DNA replication complex GINS protein PSF1 n=1 Tax=Perkinsus olseni TaxID=32597 RepID=A0A7J6MK59_PEROL|nr:DNA replication complex GINS protein PSF1 [Perkinsus olseni]KAF4671875.1 DNA replication complex GINS protein PSF1 [Perkinsus olseni]